MGDASLKKEKVGKAIFGLGILVFVGQLLFPQIPWPFVLLIGKVSILMVFIGWLVAASARSKVTGQIDFKFLALALIVLVAIAVLTEVLVARAPHHHRIG